VDARTPISSLTSLFPGRLPPSFPEHVRETLESEIVSGRLAPGERVTEESLAQRIGISRTPVREAMRVLEGQGLIVRRRGRGVYVANRTTQEEAKALYELRIPLEGFLTRQAAERAKPHELRTLAEIQESFRHLVVNEGTAVDMRALIALDSEFHWAIYRAAGSDLVSVVSSYWGRLLRELYDRVYRGEHPSTFSRQHEEIVSALEKRDSEGAHAAMAAHIASGWDVIRASFELEGDEIEQGS
jgi:DNA-binding GntR family transcriptional regulator